MKRHHTWHATAERGREHCAAEQVAAVDMYDIRRRTGEQFLGPPLHGFAVITRPERVRLRRGVHVKTMNWVSELRIGDGLKPGNVRTDTLNADHFRLIASSAQEVGQPLRVDFNAANMVGWEVWGDDQNLHRPTLII